MTCNSTDYFGLPSIALQIKKGPIFCLKKSFSIFRTKLVLIGCTNVKNCHSKFFTYVTKTCLNITTYSRKPGKYNGTIIFEIGIKKKSYPIKENLCQTWLFHKCFDCLFCFCLHCNTTESISWLQQKRSAILVLTVAKMWILNWHDINLKKKCCHCYSPVF